MRVLVDRLNTQETRRSLTDIPTTESNVLQRYIDICSGLDVIYLSVNSADQIFKADEGACGESRDAAARLCALATTASRISIYLLAIDQHPAKIQTRKSATRSATPVATRNAALSAFGDAYRKSGGRPIDSLPLREAR